MSAAQKIDQGSKSEEPSSSELLARQLRSIPVVNSAVKMRDLSGRKKLITVPLAEKRWGRVAKRIFPIRREKKLEIDALSAEILGLFDGKRTVEDVIDVHKDRWKLSFFESRGMILDFMKRMVKRAVVVLVVPEADAPGS